MKNNNHNYISQSVGCCLVLATTLFFMNDCVAARKNKQKNRISTRALLLKVKARDAIIADLMSRVELLEKHQGNPAIARQENLVQVMPPEVESGKQAEKTNNPAPSKAGETEAPGSFKVDEQASQRALERTLAKSGVLLLPTWYLDTDVNFNYTYRESPTAINNLTDVQGNAVAAIAPKIRRNIFDPSIAFRLGLPFDAQFEFSLPYRFANQSAVAQNLNGEIKANDSALGDVQIGLAKTLLKEAQWWPDVVARVTWDTGSGSGGLGNGGLLGQGVESVTGSVSMLKRQDPLAFFFNAGYTRSFTAKNYLIDGSSYNPGNIVAFSFGTQLAASADTSLSFALNELFISNTEQNSQTIAGSNRNIGILSIGASSIISRNMFINLSVGMGLTSDSPDYTAGITFSNRVNLNPYLGTK